MTRKYAVMVWDSVRERVVLFGGQEDLAAYHNDTWEWDGTRWTERQPLHRPPAREDHMMAFDSVRGRVVLFGGHDVNVRFLNDTWEWDGVDWHPMAPATVPFARAYGAMAFDPVRQLVVMYGGVDSATREIGETWEWNGTNWRPRFPYREPGRRTQHAMCWDPVRQRVVLYGGQTNESGWFADQWEYDGINWVNATTTPAGPAMSDLRMVYDTHRSRLVLWGGRSQPASSAWERDGDTWVQRTIPPPLPTDRHAHTMAFDEVRGEVVIFGGYDGGEVRYGDTWVYRPVAPASAASFGHGCGGPTSVPPALSLADGQRPWLGDTLAWRVRGDTPANLAVLSLGVSRTTWRGASLPADLGAFGMSGCELLDSSDVLLSMQVSAQGADLAMPIPVWRELNRVELYAQALVFDPASNPAGAVTTGGVALRFGSR
ncbi:MAG: hypothetical protein R3F56_14515 [Planctomycetota bacterium]